jgi:zinc and cadmium transporter
LAIVLDEALPMTLAWILGSGVVMTALALSGSITLLLDRRTLDKLILPLVAFSAGSLLGGAFLHMIPAGLQAMDSTSLFIWLLAGFITFFALEQFLHWHHCHRAAAECKKPLGYLVLLGDGIHNLIGGFAVAGTFVIDIRLGITTWLAAAAHEVPQELGDFGVLVHSGWSRGKALLFNLLSATTFLVGGVIAYVASFHLDVSFLVPFAAGNFIYIGASDLVPEVNKHGNVVTNSVHFVAFVAGVALLLVVKLGLE